MKRETVDWSELYPEILSQIAANLQTRQHLLNFRSVCRSWRISSSFPSPKTLETLPILHPLLPWKFIHSPNSDTLLSCNSHGNPLNLLANSVYLLQPRSKNNSFTKPLILTVQEFDRGKIRLLNPFTRTDLNDYCNNFPKSLCLLDFHVKLVACGYDIAIPNCVSLEKSMLDWCKAVLFPMNTRVFGSSVVEDCTIVVLFERGFLGWSRLVCEGVGELGSGYLRCGNVTRFDDIVHFKECVYAIDRRGRVFVIYYHDRNLKVKCVANDVVFSGCDSEYQKRLVVDTHGLLYMVCRDVYCGKIHFKVYRLDEEEERCQWDEVSGLGDRRVLFVGVDWCFFASADDFPGCRENCIFFHRDSFSRYDKSFFAVAHKELDVGVFHLGDSDAGLVSDYPGIIDILWPFMSGEKGNYCSVRRSPYSKVNSDNPKYSEKGEPSCTDFSGPSKGENEREVLRDYFSRLCHAAKNLVDSIRDWNRIMREAKSRFPGSRAVERLEKSALDLFTCFGSSSNMQSNSGSGIISQSGEFSEDANILDQISVIERRFLDCKEKLLKSSSFRNDLNEVGEKEHEEQIGIGEENSESHGEVEQDVDDKIQAVDVVGKGKGKGKGKVAAGRKRKRKAKN